MALLRRDKERAATLEEFAGAKGLSYEAKDSMGINAYFKDMKLFRQGGSRRALNLIQRREQVFDNSGMFDYHYTVSNGKTSRTYRQSVYFRVHQELILPEFHLFPEKFYHRIGKWFGVQDINFVEYPEFSKSFMLQGPLPDFIWRLFQDDKLIMYFDTHRDVSVEAVGRYFVLYRPDILQPVKDIPQFLKVGDALYQLFLKRNKLLEERLKG